MTIVVGVDGSPAGDAALLWALTEARTRKSTARVVHAYQPVQVRVPAAGGAGFAPPTVAFTPEEADRVEEEARTKAEGIIDSALARVGRKAADGVKIERAPIAGPPAETLIEASRGAELLVLGSHGRGSFVDVLLGSVSRRCTQHPPCPVVVLPQAEA